MKRINESEAAKVYVAKLREGCYPLERSENTGENHREKKEERDTKAVRKFTNSALFEEFKKMK